MLARRVIPVLLARGHQLVKGERFNSWRSVGHVLQAAKIHQARGVDELIVLDIGATPERRGPDFEFIEKLTSECFMPLTVGGGVRSVEDVRWLLALGADKVAICTAAVANPCLIAECASRFGSQAIVVAIDVSDGRVVTECNGRAWYIGPPEKWAQSCEYNGAGEILLTSVDRDGTLQGYDLELVRRVSEAVSVPVIAAGGCSGYEDMRLAIEAGASAVAAGALFQFTDATPRGAAEYLAAHGIEARLAA